jgi:acyl dehydratase
LSSIDRLGDPADGEVLEAFVLDDSPAHIDNEFARRSTTFLI